MATRRIIGIALFILGLGLLPFAYTAYRVMHWPLSSLFNFPFPLVVLGAFMYYDGRK